MTLAEVLAAAAVVAIGLVALASAIPVANYGIQEGRQLSTATFLANQRLEQVRNARWEGGAVPMDTVGVSATATAPPVSDGVVTFPDESPMAAPFTGYDRRVRVIECGAGVGCGSVVDTGLRQVIVTVDYRPLTGLGVAAPAHRRGAIVSMYLSKR
jgi:hypothetical protein